MKHVNKKGFTLVELLSIIIILGIIALITVPVVANIMKDMKKKSFKSSVNGLVESSKMYYSKKVNDSDFEGNVFSFGKDEKLDGLEIKGKHPIDGEILLNVDGEIKLYVTDGEFCAFKSFDSNIITITENLDCINKSETPIINVVSNKSTTNRISVVANCSYDSGNEIEIEKYEFSKDGGKTWDSRKVDNKALNYYTYSNLKQDEDYEFVARCITKVGTSAQKTIDVNLVDIDKTLIDVPNGWAKEKEVTISYPKGRYIYQYQELESASDVISDDNWVTVEETTSNNSYNVFKKTYTENKYLVVRVLDDSGNYIDSENIAVQKIDRTPPACGSWIGNSTWTNQNVTVKLACNEIQDENNNISGCTASSYNVQTYSTTTQTASLSYTIKDNAGNETKCSNSAANVYVDKTVPSAPTTMSFVFGNWSAYTNNSWTNQSVYVARTSSSQAPTGAADSHSGISRYQISSDGVNWVDYAYNTSSSMYVLSTTGTHTRYFRAVDKAGNVSSAISRVAKIDKAAPGTASSVIRIGSSSGAVRANTTAWTNQTLWWGGFSATDTGGSGISYYQYSTGCTGTASATLGSSYTYSSNTNYAFCIRAVDVAGNAGAWSGAYYIRVDKTAPTMSWSHSSGTLTSGTTVTVSCSDGHSGMSSTSMTDMGYTTTGTSSTSQSLSSKRCSKATTATCTDAAGNTTSGSMTYSVYHTCSRTAYSYKGSYCGTTCTSAGGTQVNDSYCGGGSCCCRFANGLEKYSCCS